VTETQYAGTQGAGQPGGGMKHLLVGILFLLSPSLSLAGDLKTADSELTKVYEEVLGKYKSDPEFIGKLKAAQRAWIQFRDAHLEARFPKEDKRAEYGSVYPVCAGQILAELTEARTKQLRAWLDGTVEGDACSGSIGRK
jgi:uncharacterized protein YecT (DUF1311 family)